MKNIFYLLFLTLVIHSYANAEENKLFGEWRVISSSVSSIGTSIGPNRPAEILKTILVVGVDKFYFKTINKTYQDYDCTNPKFLKTENSFSSWFNSNYDQLPEKFIKPVLGFDDATLYDLKCTNADAAQVDFTLALAQDNRLGINGYDSAYLILEKIK